MNLIAGIFVTLLLTVTTKAQTCTPIQRCDATRNGYCYAFVDQRIDWYHAQGCCEAWGGNLASIHSADDNILLNDIRNQDRTNWIGLNDIASEGNFEWSDGSSYNYNNFNTASGNPSNSHGGEDCVHFFDRNYNALTWNDYRCDGLGWETPTSYICQKSEFCCILIRISILTVIGEK